MSEPLTADERQMLREVHLPNVRTDKFGHRTFEVECPFEKDGEWPCLTVRLLDERDALAAELADPVPDQKNELVSLLSDARKSLLAHYEGRAFDILVRPSVVRKLLSDIDAALAAAPVPDQGEAGICPECARRALAEPAGEQP